MQAPLKEKNDIKIFILYLLKNIDYPLDFSNVNDIVVQDELVGYFDFAECFADLLEAGHILEEKIDGVEYYSISPTGIQVAKTLQSNLLNAIRDKSLKSALRLLSFKKRGSQIQCTPLQREDGKYQLNCKIIEHDEELLSVTVVLDTKAQLERMKYNFDNRPEVVYRGIFALLSGEVNYLLE